jgi:general secretion pathway protein G
MGLGMTPGRKATISIQQSAVSGQLDTVAARGSTCGTRRFRRGFTLIEMLIVVTIIGILVTLAQPSFNRAVTAAKEATLKENLFILRDVIDQFYADNTKYPTALTELVEKGYIRQVPKDPITGSAETWVAVPAADEQGQPVGVFDVKSGSDRTARDGSRYADW